jgi:hypothetical protein
LSSAGDSGNTWSRSRVRCARSAEAPKLASAKHESQATHQEAPLPDRLLHDVGAFQIGIGVSVLLSLMWSDSIGVALVGFIVAGAIHSIITRSTGIWAATLSISGSSPVLSWWPWAR